MIKVLPFVIFVATLTSKGLIDKLHEMEFKQHLKTASMAFEITLKSSDKVPMYEALGIDPNRVSQLNLYVKTDLERKFGQGNFPTVEILRIVGSHCQNNEEFAYSCFSAGLITAQSKCYNRLYYHPNWLKRLIIRCFRLHELGFS